MTEKKTVTPPVQAIEKAWLFRILPAVGDPSRADVLADIAERTKTGERFITYEIV